MRDTFDKEEVSEQHEPTGTPECVVDGQLKCVEKRDLTKRGVRYSFLKLRRSSYSVKFTVPADQAAGILIGGYYKIAVLPDAAPAAVELPTLTPGDHVLEWSKRADLKVWRPAVLVGFTPGGRAIIYPWRRRESEDVNVKVILAKLTLAPGQFPAREDLTAVFIGDEMIWKGRVVTVSAFASLDRAVVTFRVSLWQSASRLVPISQLLPRALPLPDGPLSTPILR